MNLASRIARKILPSRPALMGAASAATLGLVGLVALAGAAIPSSEGSVSACYHRSNGNLRVIDAEAGETCKNNENHLTLQQQDGLPGPQGEPGPAGPTGPQGPAGAPGGSVASLNDLDGIACSRFDGEPGVLSISHGEGSSILFDCNPISTCGDDTHGDLPSEAVSVGSVSGDNPNQAGPISAIGIICPGDVDYFTVAINENLLDETRDLQGLIRIQMTPGVPLMITPSILSASNAASSAFLPTDAWTVDMAVNVTDGPSADFVILQFKVEGATPAITGYYTLSAYGPQE